VKNSSKKSVEEKSIKKRLSTIASLASHYDFLRNNVVIDPEKVLKKSKEIGEGKKHWKHFAKETRKVVARIKKTAKIGKIVKISRALESITLIYFMLVIIAALAWQLKIDLPPELWFISSNSPLLTLPSIILLFVIADITLFMLTLTRYEIKKYIREGVKEDKLAKQRLKEIAQYYIDKLAEEIKRYNFEPEKVKIKLRTTDYKGIKIVEKPGFLRGYYLAIVDTEKSRKK